MLSSKFRICQTLQIQESDDLAHLPPLPHSVLNNKIMLHTAPTILVAAFICQRFPQKVTKLMSSNDKKTQHTHNIRLRFFSQLFSVARAVLDVAHTQPKIQKSIITAFRWVYFEEFISLHVFPDFLESRKIRSNFSGSFAAA